MLLLAPNSYFYSLFYFPTPGEWVHQQASIFILFGSQQAVYFFYCRSSLLASRDRPTIMPPTHNKKMKKK
jgi:hypothetical protein